MDISGVGAIVTGEEAGWALPLRVMWFGLARK